MAFTQISTDGIKNGSLTGADFATNIDLSDSQKIRFGAGNDLQIYHNSTSNNSHIDESGSGSLVIKATNTYINAANDQAMIAAIAGGAVELYYANSRKAFTYSDGLHIDTGTLRGDDNAKVVLGDSSDLQLFHDGSTSLIQSASHPLAYYSNTRHHFLNGDGSENMAVFIANSSCDLYYDGSKKFETENLGVKVYGHIFADDNNELRLGNSGDLQLYHNGTHSYIYNATGGLYIQVGNGEFLNRSGNEVIAKFLENGAVELYYDNSKKFETVSGGVNVTGYLQTSSHVYLPDNVKVLAGNAQDLEIFHDGSNSLIVNKTGNLGIKAQEYEEGIIIRRNGSVDLYYDNSKKFETTGDGIQLTGDVRFNNGAWTGEVAGGKIQTHSNNMYFQIPNTSGAEWIFRADDGVNRATINLNGSYSSSDERFKKDITTITSAVDTIKQLIGRSFTWKGNNKESFGLIAQEVETVLPDLVMNQQLVDGETNSDPYKSVNYAALTGHLVEAIKEAVARIEALEAK